MDTTGNVCTTATEKTVSGDVTEAQTPHPEEHLYQVAYDFFMYVDPVILLVGLIGNTLSLIVMQVRVIFLDLFCKIRNLRSEIRQEKKAALEIVCSERRKCLVSIKYLNPVKFNHPSLEKKNTIGKHTFGPFVQRKDETPE